MYSARICVKDYERLARRLNPVDFSAEEWVDLAKAAGMKATVKKASFLITGKQLTFSRKGEHLRIAIPATPPIIQLIMSISWLHLASRNAVFARYIPGPRR